MSLPTITIDQDVLSQEGDAFDIFNEFERHRNTNTEDDDEYAALFFGKSDNINDETNWTLHDKNNDFNPNSWRTNGSNRTENEIVPDVEIVKYSLNNTSTEKKTLRISNFYYSTGYSGQLFTPQFSIPAGRDESTVINSDESDRRRYAYFKFRFKTVTESQQDGLHIQFWTSQKYSSNRGAGIYIRDNNEYGLNVYEPWSKTIIAKNLDRTKIHTIEMETDFGSEEYDHFRVRVNKTYAVSLGSFQEYWTKLSRVEGVDSLTLRLAFEGSSGLKDKGIYIVSFEQSSSNSSLMSDYQEGSSVIVPKSLGERSININPSTETTLNLSDISASNGSVSLSKIKSGKMFKISSNANVSIRDSEFNQTFECRAKKLILRHVSGKSRIKIVETQVDADDASSTNFSITRGQFTNLTIG